MSSDHPDPIGAPSLPHTWYAKRSRVVTAIVGVIILVGLCALAVALPEDGGWGFGSRLGIVLTGVVGLGVMLMLGRPSITADTTGVTVVNLTRTTRLEWPQIIRVYLRPGDPWVYLDLSDGETLPVMGIQTSNGKTEAIAAAGRLRDLVETHGSTPDTH